MLKRKTCVAASLLRFRGSKRYTDVEVTANVHVGLDAHLFNTRLNNPFHKACCVRAWASVMKCGIVFEINCKRWDIFHTMTIS